PASGAGSGSGSGGAQTVTGEEAPTRYGPVQVQITVTDGRVTDIEPVEYPQDTPRDQQINAFPIPRLDRETLAARGRRDGDGRPGTRRSTWRRARPTPPRATSRPSRARSTRPGSDAPHGPRRGVHGYGLHDRRPRPRPVGRRDRRGGDLAAPRRRRVQHVQG